MAKMRQVIRTLQKQWAPPPDLTVSEWADDERQLSPESSPEPGRYRTARTEYAREMMDAFNNPKVKTIIGMCSAQVAKTTIEENVIGYFVHHDPSPIMVVMPTLEIAEMFSKDRLSPMVRDTPALTERFSEPGSRNSGNTLLHKKFNGGQLTIAGANSFNSLASRPTRIVLGDEAAKWKPNEQGSPFRQVSARTKAFWNSKVAYFSTPTSQKNEFQDIWDESDKRVFEIPCPHCGVRVVLTFDETPGSLPSDTECGRAILQWTEGVASKTDDGRVIRRCVDAWFQCLECNRRIDDVERQRAVQQGTWRATQAFFGTAGFWMWEGYSPFSNAKKIADAWLSSLGDPVQLQSVKNETLGLPWKESGTTSDWKRVFDRREDYQIGTVPDGALLLTAGADVQADRIEVQVIGWGRNRECWLVDYIVLSGDTARPEVWNQLTSVLSTMYRNPSKGYELRIVKLAIDSGFSANEVYEWARKNRFGPIAVIKGGPDSQTALVSAASPVEINLHGKKIPAGVNVHTVNVGEFKKQLYGRLALDLPNLEKGEPYPEGFFHICSLPDTEEYCRQLTAEQLVTRTFKGRSRREWELIRPRNEALDTWNYAAVAMVMLRTHTAGIENWDSMEASLGVKAAPAVRSQTPSSFRPVIGKISI